MRLGTYLTGLTHLTNSTSPIDRATARRNPTGPVRGNGNVHWNPGEFVEIFVQTAFFKPGLHWITTSVRSPVVVVNCPRDSIHLRRAQELRRTGEGGEKPKGLASHKSERTAYKRIVIGQINYRRP